MRNYLFVTVLLLASPQFLRTNQDVSVNFDHQAQFAKFKTYKWVPVEGAQHLDDLTADQLVGTLNVALEKKGLKRSEDKPDLYIAYQIASGNEKKLSQFDLGASYGSGTGASGTGGASTTVVHSGLLVLDLYDVTTKKLIWRGVVSNAFAADAKPDKKQKQMDAAVDKLLKGYPPAAK
ncbi:MAG TPA: DUF4136 domain-containing protein [Candidatus Sulfotelmatobacter sp.]|nr:DUF4136 domain-containing protein [Candidatus Sulfotelmatobacter sp.]